MGTPEARADFDLLYAFRDEVSRVTGVRMPSGTDLTTRKDRRRRRSLCPRSSRINRVSRGEPMSCGNGTQRGRGSPPEKQLPYDSTSGRWTPTCPWRTCAML